MVPPARLPANRPPPPGPGSPFAGMPNLIQTLTTDSRGWSAYNLVLRIPYVSSFVGKAIYGQAAWLDSVSGQLLLSRAYSSLIAAQPENPSQRFLLYAIGAVSATAQDLTYHQYFNPIPLYTFQ